MGEIRTLDRHGLQTLLDWAAVEGWNPGLDDAEVFYSADPQGFLGLYLDDVPVAGLSLVRQGPEFAFLGLYICRPEWRGQGLGWKLWQAGMARFKGATIALDGVVEQQANYQRSGFTLAHRNIRYAGRTEWAVEHDAQSSGEAGNDAQLERVGEATDGVEIRAPAASDIALALELDYRIQGVNRSDYMQAWWAQSPHRITRVAARDGQLLGVATVRACREHHKIGPVLADNADTALALIDAVVKTAGAQHIIIDVPEPNGQAVSLVQALGLAPSFETARMYRGPAPRGDLSKLFGVASLELG